MAGLFQSKRPRRFLIAFQFAKNFKGFASVNL